MRFVLLKFGDAVHEVQGAQSDNPVAAEGTNRYVRDFIEATVGGERLIVSLGAVARHLSTDGIQAFTVRGAATDTSRVRAFVRLTVALASILPRIVRFRADVIVCMDTGLPALAAWVAAHAGGAQLVMCATVQIGGPGIGGWLRRRTARLAIRSRKTIAVLACTPSVASAIKTEISPGASVTVYSPRLEQLVVATESPRGLDQRHQEALFVGRLSEVKGVGDLPAIASALGESESGRLVVVGDGPLGSWLTTELENKDVVQWTERVGQQPHSCVLDRMASARVLVMPSRSEGVAKVAAESLIAGTPVVAYRVGGVPDTVVDNENGLLVSRGDIGQLCDAVVRVMGNDSLWEKLRAGCTEYRMHATENLYAFGDALTDVLDGLETSSVTEEPSW